jgi:hypothetical protein
MATKSESAQDQVDYHSYLLRLWRESGAGEAGRGAAESPEPGEWVWRASLESPQAGERQGFANLEDLFAFLRQQTSFISEADRDGAT